LRLRATARRGHLDVDDRRRNSIIEIGKQGLACFDLSESSSGFGVDIHLLPEIGSPACARLHPLVCAGSKGQGQQQNGCAKSDVLAIFHKTTPRMGGRLCRRTLKAIVYIAW
jgi:hypothetical protein